jgi:hypothetical protein
MRLPQSVGGGRTVWRPGPTPAALRAGAGDTVGPVTSTMVKPEGGRRPVPPTRR